MMKARDDQFVLKNGKKHHPYPPKEVPYPRSYERQAIDRCVMASTFMPSSVLRCLQ